MVRRIGERLGGARQNAEGKSSFKQRYDDAERRRAAILRRLEGLNDAARAHPAYRRALTLVNQTFRNALAAGRCQIPAFSRICK
jgi:hypothetical protein